MLQEENVFEALLDPNRVFNTQERNFNVCPKKSKVLAEKDTKDVYHIDQADSNFSITVILAF